MGGFKSQEGEFIFVAGSSDIKPARERVETLVEAQLRYAGLDRVRTYSWDIDYEITGAGFDPRRTMQCQLPRPTARNCLAVVCIFGERIGLPLEDDFDVLQIAGWERWKNPNHRYRAVHPWPHNEADANALLNDGAYPLTGTVFEFLDAHGAPSPPLWFTLLADEPITEAHPDVVINGKHYFQQITGNLGQDATARSSTDGEYFRQTRGIRNFMLAVGRAHIDQNPLRFDTTAFDRSVRTFLVDRVIQKRAKRSNPYRKLNYYDIGDGEDFDGRDEFVNQAVSELESNRPSMLRIVGPSGIGKSSVVRAGILRHFREDLQYRGRFACLAVRPEDFRDAGGHIMPVIGTLLDLISLRTDLELPRREVAELRWKGALASPLAVELVRRVLERPNGLSRLIIALDQFEEIVDELTDPHEADCWRPLLAFVNAAAATNLIWLVYTLESSRSVTHDSLKLGPAFERALELKLDDISWTFVNTIIGKPFGKAGFALSFELVKEIHDRFERIRANDDQEARGAALPLLALRLWHLFEAIQNRFEPSFDQREVGNALRSAALAGDLADPRRSNGISKAQLEEAEIALDFDPVIRVQAERAWRQATGSPVIDPLDLDQFLQPFVGTKGGRPQLKTIPKTFADDGHQELADAFVRARLLTPVRDAAVRVVHEAVIDRWPAARGWFDSRQAFLATKEKLYRADLETKASMFSEEQIDLAAEVLAAHYRAWGEQEAPLSPEDEKVRAYCLAVFENSCTPMRPAAAFPAPRNHLAIAALYGLGALLDRFIELEPSCIDSLDPGSKRPPLRHAAWHHTDAVALLLRRGAEPIAKDSQGWPAVTGAIQKDAREICHALLERAADVFGTVALERVTGCPGGATLLHLCAAWNRSVLAETLATMYRFNPTATDDIGWTPLHVAASAGKADAFRFFADFTPLSQPTHDKSTVLHLAARAGKEDLVSFVLDRNSALARAEDQYGDLPLHDAAREGHPRCVSFLLPFSDPNKKNKRGESALSVAIAAPEIQSDEESKIAIVTALLADVRTNPNEVDVGRLARPLQGLLLKNPRFDLAKTSGADEEPAFFLLARRRMWAELGRFLSVNDALARQVKNKKNETLLHRLAAENPPMNLAFTLLKDFNPARLNIQNDAGRTALDETINSKNWALAECFLATPGIELTPHTELTNGTFALAIEHGASIEWLRDKLLPLAPSALSQTDRFGWTPIHHAAAHQLESSLKTLTVLTSEKPELWTLPDAQGRTAADFWHPQFRTEWPGAQRTQLWPAPSAWDSDANWAEVSPEERALLLEKIHAIVPNRVTLTEVGPTCRIERGMLACYPRGVTLLRVFDPSWANPRRRLYFVDASDSLFKLDGTSTPIHDLNEKRSDSGSTYRASQSSDSNEQQAASPASETVLSLRADTVLAYMRFFCFFVHGSEGPFVVLESASQGELRTDLADATRETIYKYAHPSWLRGEHEGVFYVAASVLYGSALFAADFKITKNGLIEMLDDQPLASLEGAGDVIDCPIV